MGASLLSNGSKAYAQHTEGSHITFLPSPFALPFSPETMSYSRALAGLGLPMQIMLASDSKRASCFCFPSARIRGVQHHTLPVTLLTYTSNWLRNAKKSTNKDLFLTSKYPSRKFITLTHPALLKLLNIFYWNLKYVVIIFSKNSLRRQPPYAQDHNMNQIVIKITNGLDLLFSVNRNNYILSLHTIVWKHRSRISSPNTSLPC